VLKHELTPPARILSEKEKAEFLKKYGITEPEKQLPKIRESDPLVKALGAKVGDIIEFKRKDNYLGIEYSYWRIVVGG